MHAHGQTGHRATKIIVLVAKMSSLAAARADNFYYGPDYRPEDGSLNKARGAPPGNLGKRAKKMDQGILVIR
jgi:coiled-coil domain-containing protein 130